MKAWYHPMAALLLAIPIGLGTATLACGEEIPLGAPPPSPMTFWNFLGIPQGGNQVGDALTNRRGNNPNRERVEPLKRIADPANAEAKNPAIAAAAKIKQDQDLAPQKIKALKYLATIGCCCNANKEKVKNAMLAALDDCTEAVRYEAAVAICQAAGNRCSTCNQCSCCGADVMNKLNEMTGQDEKGCCREPSARVRQAAAKALEHCRQVRRPTEATPGVVPGPETPREHRATPPPTPKPGQPTAAPLSPTSAPDSEEASYDDPQVSLPRARPLASQLTSGAGFALASDQVVTTTDNATVKVTLVRHDMRLKPVPAGEGKLQAPALLPLETVRGSIITVR